MFSVSFQYDNSFRDWNTQKKRSRKLVGASSTSFSEDFPRQFPWSLFLMRSRQASGLVILSQITYWYSLCLLVEILIHKYYVFIYFCISFLHLWTEAVIGLRYMSAIYKLATDTHKEWSTDRTDHYFQYNNIQCCHTSFPFFLTWSVNTTFRREDSPNSESKKVSILLYTNDPIKVGHLDNWPQLLISVRKDYK